jgi:DNA-binding MarR family transcriptional regulator
MPTRTAIPKPLRERQVDAIRALARASRTLERASGELSLAHYRILSAVASGDERASRVAQRLAIGKPTVSAAVEALTQRGLLRRSEVAGDQRASVLSMTPDGRSLLTRVENDMLQRLGELGIDSTEGEQLISSLIWLGQAMDERQARRVERERTK